MQKFDDTVFVASLTPQQQLPQIVLLLQDVRRQTAALDIAVCVGTLHLAAVNYQNAVVVTPGGGPGDKFVTNKCGYIESASNCTCSHRNSNQLDRFL